MQKDFERFAGSACGVGSTTLGRYGAVLNSRINPTIIEERQLNVAAMDVFSRLMMDRIIFLGVPIAADADRDFWMNAPEAVEYGMADAILSKKSK